MDKRLNTKWLRPRPGPGQESESESESKSQTLTKNSEGGVISPSQLFAPPPFPTLLEAIGQKTCAVGGTALRARQQLHIEERRKELAEKRVQSTDRSRNTLPTSLTHTHTHTKPREKEFLLIKCVIIAQKYTPTTTRKVSRVRRVSHVTRHEYFEIKLNSRDRAADLS